MATMAKDQNYSSLVPCPSLFPSSVTKLFGVLFCWGFLRRTRIFPGILFTSLKLSVTLAVLSVTAKKPQTNVEERHHRECRRKWEREQNKTRGGASVWEPQLIGSLCLHRCSAPQNKARRSCPFCWPSMLCPLVTLALDLAGSKADNERASAIFFQRAEMGMNHLGCVSSILILWSSVDLNQKS